MEIERRKILVVDDSALMRRVLCDIINSDKRFQVVARACDGVEAFDLLTRQTFDGVVLDINMPRMNGLQLLAELRKFKISAKVMIASTDSMEGAKVTMEALDLGALDFIQKPGTSFECRGEDFTRSFLDTLYAVCISRMPVRSVISPALQPTAPRTPLPGRQTIGTQGRIGTPTTPARTERTFSSDRLQGGDKPATSERPAADRGFSIAPSKGGRKIVAIACSTGGPRALQSVLPLIPKEIDAPIVLVQHMPKGFTASLAERLDNISKITVREAKEGESLEKGVAYISMGGMHMNVKSGPGASAVIHYSDEPAREGVKPCANYMYESLADCKYDEILCVVLTGMGADGTEGIANLKKSKKIKVLSQNSDSCVVYGMPKSVVNAGLSDLELPLDNIAAKISEWAGTEM